MELTWWGAAGFQIKSGRKVLIIDPYLSRNSLARPSQYMNPAEIKEGEMIFLSHGHFDHLLDVPVIADSTGATVFCSSKVALTLQQRGLSAKKIHEVTEDGYKLEFQGFQAEAYFSEHVVFDRKLISKTLRQSKLSVLKHWRLLRDFPKGQVLSWRFKIEDKIIHFFGSAGSTAEEMEKLASRRTDILLVPLQGHSDICNIALEYVHVMRPEIVIPHHHDDFYPPISSSVDIQPFLKGVKRECPASKAIVLELNETAVL
jgi:L-ascorbate metabolism protein UlaG (beta-lactamase superfamily)